MIQLPRRSVTRFFIPLIDVLILLFCIFLLMPLVKGSGDEPGGAPAATPEEEVERLRQEVARLKNERGDTPEKLREELDRLRREKVQALQERLAVRVLEIDAAAGDLYYNDPERTKVGDEATAHALIDRDRRALGGGRRELYYLVLYPRGRSVYPLASQRRRYDAWFADVPHGWDIPGAPLKGWHAMTTFGLELPTADVIGQWVLRALAVAGAAAVGGFLVGLITQGLSRLLTTRPVPRVPLNVLRLLGAVVCGWLAVLMLFHGLGGGGGGGLWPFGGAGAAGGDATGKEPPHAGETAKAGGPRETGKAPADDGRSLRVEVLPKEPAEYRVPAESRTYTFDELTKYLAARKKASPDLKELKILLAEDVLPNVSAVTDLAAWAKDHGLTASVSDRPG